MYHRRLGPLLADAAAGRVLIDVDDGSGVAPLAGSVAFEAAIASADRVDELPAPSPDDLYLVCTGGTTGRPKGVLWRQGDVYVAGDGRGRGRDRDDDRASRGAEPATALVRGAAAHARGRAVDRVRDAAQRRHRRAPRRCRAVRRAHDPRDGGARTRAAAHDRRRRVRATDRRRAARRFVRPVGAAAARDRRRDDEPRR